MKRKNGFTLIELLAVIVILAIIALIATPIVLNIISETKESAMLRSAEFYLDSAEYAVAQEMMNNPIFKPSSCEIQSDGNLKCDGTKVEVEISGEKPKGGTIELDEGKINAAEIVLGEKTIIKNEEDLAFKGEENDNLNIVFEGEVDFSYIPEENIGFLEVNEEFFYKFKPYKMYGLSINNQEYITLYSSYSNHETMIYMSDIDETTIVMVDAGDLNMIYLGVITSTEMTGKQNIKLVEIEDPYPNYGMKIQKTGPSWLYSRDFVEGEANVYITDENNTIYCNKQVVFEKEYDGFVGIYSYDNRGLANLQNVYEAVTNGKKITIKVTQIVDGKERVTIIDGTPNFEEPDYSNYKNICYWGNPMIPSAS